MKNDEYYIKEAITEARKAYRKGEVPVGCVIVVNDCIIARAHNLRESKKNTLAHAEILAINKACRKLKRSILDDTTIYITVEPCLMCAGAIFQARIKRVVFGTQEPKFGVLGSVIDLSKIDGFNHKITVTKGILSEETAILMKKFFRELRVR
ncbi:MAG: tRNA adenosine(34) deaminase TadA [Bacilli bacterium]|nr:tRNA adenosine(34) deaminase TadA [Bacilli bacterium]MDD4078065.1 tRNA adenosine(34) deaminase TadA [Bacilli bacterium]